MLQKAETEDSKPKTFENMVLYKSKKEFKLDKLSKKLLIILLNHETNGNSLQQEKLKKNKLEQKQRKARKQKITQKKLLQNCKSWSGPCTPVEELQQILKKKCDQDFQIVKTELAYYAHTHKANKLGSPDLFRLNGISHEEKLTDLVIMLSENCISARTVADLPTNDDVVAVLEGTTTEQQSNEPNNLKVNELCVLV